MWPGRCRCLMTAGEVPVLRRVPGAGTSYRDWRVAVPGEAPRLLRSWVLPGCPALIPHGGGAVPYHWGCFRGLADMLGRPPLAESVMGNVFFDTCVYHQPGINLLFDVIDIGNILFGSEVIEAVRGIDPHTQASLRRHPPLYRRPRSGARRLRPGLRAQRPPGVPAPRRACMTADLAKSGTGARPACFPEGASVGGCR